MHLDFMMKKQELNPKMHSSKSTTDSVTDRIGDSTEQQMLPCYICQKLYHSGKARILHVKMCARINNVSTPDLLLLIKKSNSLTEKEEKELQNNRQLLAECDNLFTKQPHIKGGSSTKKRKVTYFDPVSAMEEEELQVALAISASLTDQEVEVVESSSMQKGDLGEGLLLPAAVATAELVESRTEALLCSKTSHINKDYNKSDNELFFNQLDTADSNDPIKYISDVNDRSKKDDSEKEYSNDLTSKDHQSDDTPTKRITLWNVAGYAENEPSKIFYALPLLETNLQTQD